MATTARTHSGSNVFRPRYPLDPFTNAPEFSSGSRIPQHPSQRRPFDLHNPWLLKPEHLPSQALRRDVILVLGTPADRSLDSFLSSPTMSNSLVIIATHAPPQMPPSFAPTIRILRLNKPLVVEDNGAVRLVSILEWAERIARIWRAHGPGDSERLEFDEVTMGNVIEAPRIVRSTPGSPLGSSATLGKGSWKGSLLSSKSKRFSFLSSRRLSSVSFGPSPPSLPSIDPTQRPFDTIINHVSDGVAEKLILKQTILVTSITRPFLASTLSPYDKLTLQKKSKRRPVSRQPSLYSLPPTPPYHSGVSLHPASSSMTAISSMSTSMLASISAPPTPSAHMIHIMPRFARPNLIQSLDSFLSSFSISNVSDDTIHAKQYIMNPSTLCDSFLYQQDNEQSEWLIADLILNGSLDDVRGKAWVGSGQDILLLPPGSSSFSSASSVNAAPSKAQGGRSLSDHMYPTAPRAQLAPIVTSNGESSTRTVADLTPPPSPRSRTRTKSVPSKAPQSPMPAPSTSSAVRPKRNPSYPRPHSEAIDSSRPSHPRSSPSTLRVPSSSEGRNTHSRRSDVPPALPPKDGPPSISVPHGSSIPTLSGFALTGSSKAIRRSRLNNIVNVDGDPARTFPTPPDSDDSGESGQSPEKLETSTRSKWIFWKTR